MSDSLIYKIEIERARHERPPIDAIERRFLAEIVANPDDDAARLVYADWLSSHAELAMRARGELIAVECELARLAHDVPEYNRLKQRDFELLREFGNTWCAFIGLDGAARERWPPEWNVDFERGFITTVSLSEQWLRRVSVALFATETVRDLEISRFEAKSFERFAAMPVLVNLRRLVLNASSFAGIEALFDSPYLEGLETFGFCGRELADDAVRGLVAALGERHAKLVHLDFTGARLGPAFAQILAASPSCAQLRTLVLDGTNVATEDITMLRGAPNLASCRIRSD